MLFFPSPRHKNKNLCFKSCRSNHTTFRIRTLMWIWSSEIARDGSHKGKYMTGHSMTSVLY